MLLWKTDGNKTGVLKPPSIPFLAFGIILFESLVEFISFCDSASIAGVASFQTDDSQSPRRCRLRSVRAAPPRATDACSSTAGELPPMRSRVLGEIGGGAFWFFDPSPDLNTVFRSSQYNYDRYTTNDSWAQPDPRLCPVSIETQASRSWWYVRHLLGWSCGELSLDVGSPRLLTVVSATTVLCVSATTERLGSEFLSWPVGARGNNLVAFRKGVSLQHEKCRAVYNRMADLSVRLCRSNELKNKV